MTKFILLPGIYGSGEAHWHTHWERENANMQRFQPASWDKPDLGQWIDTLEDAVVSCGGNCILVAHSLACLLVAHWHRATRQSVAGAFLVSVPNPQSPAFPADAQGFADVPQDQLTFPSLIVASTSDPFGSVDYMRERARQWGSHFVIAGDLGHINAKSNLGNWPQGQALLGDFATKIGASGYDRAAAIA